MTGQWGAGQKPNQVDFTLGEGEKSNMWDGDRDHDEYRGCKRNREAAGKSQRRKAHEKRRARPALNKTKSRKKRKSKKKIL